MGKDARNPFHVAVGARLAAARKAADGMEQAELADRIGASPQALNNWETGLALLPPRMALPIFQVLGIDPNYLYMAREDTLPGNIAAGISRKKRPRTRRGSSI